MHIVFDQFFFIQKVKIFYTSNTIFQNVQSNLFLTLTNFHIIC